MAKRHPARRRVAPESQRVEPDDAFVAQVFVLSTWARKNTQTLIIAGIALAMLIGASVYYASYRRDLNRQAIAELERVQLAVAFGLPEEAELELSRYLQRFGGTRHAVEARVLLGQLHLSHGRPQQAVAVLEDTPRSGSDPMRIQAGMLLGRSYEEAGRLPDAERQYLAVAAAASLEFQQRGALADAARVRSNAGDHTGAAELYRRILDDLDGAHLDRDRFEMRLQEELHQARG